MRVSGESNSIPKTFPSPKIIEVETTLQKTIIQFRDLSSIEHQRNNPNLFDFPDVVREFEELHIENENFRSLIQSQKEKCEIQSCASCEDYKKDVLNTKHILENIVSALKKLSETKDFKILDTILQLIYKETNVLNILTPPKDNSLEKQELDLASPRKESVANESTSEIEGTPSGKKSPIMISKKKTSRQLSLKDKKKCSEWPIPEPKNLKMSNPTPTKNKTKLRQSRIELVKLKNTCVVDLTCSPELKRGYNETNIQNIKKEVIDNDDTILPSPTSGPLHFQPIHKSLSKDSLTKFKQPFMTKLNTEDKDIQNKLTKNIKENEFKRPIKLEQNDETYCPDESISLLDRVAKMDNKIKLINSPIKRPLVENANVINTQTSEASMSILPRDIKYQTNELKRIKPAIEDVEKRTEVQKERVVEKICDKCKSFIELYKDNPDMISKIRENCSRLQHKVNLRPKTPDGFWNPRWDVPEDTEEFNRRNNV